MKNVINEFFFIYLIMVRGEDLSDLLKKSKKSDEVLEKKIEYLYESIEIVYESLLKFTQVFDERFNNLNQKYEELYNKFNSVKSKYEDVNDFKNKKYDKVKKTAQDNVRSDLMNELKELFSKAKK